MASVRKYKAKSAKRGYLWRVQYRSADGRSRTKQGFPTRDAAQAWAEKNATEVRTGDWLDPSSGKVTVSELREAWEAAMTHLKPKTRHEALAMWRRSVEPEWGRRQVATIRPSEVQAWVSTMEQGPSYVRQAHAVLAQVLDVAVGDRAIKLNPARGVRLPRKERGVKVYLTMDQLVAFAAESTHPEIIWLLGTVGLRWGEMAVLRPQDVDVLRRRIRVERASVTVGSEIVIGTPKTHERRTVMVPGAVMDMLVPVMDGRAPDELIWPSRTGEPKRPPTHGSWYYGALARIQSRDPEFPWVTPHGLRHVAAGLMVSEHANVLAVCRQLGHASPMMTLDTYAELFTEDLEALGERMDEVVRAARHG